jgi:predicted nucleic acid-binding protein
VNDQFIIDTDIWIDFLRGGSQAQDFINGLKIRPFLSAITVGELYAGVREGKERQQLDRLVGPMLPNVLVPYVKA